MKIELTNEMPAGVAPRADGRGEAHVRVLSNEPAGPEVWADVAKMLPEMREGFFEEYEGKFEQWFPELTELEEDEFDYDGYGYEQWFVVAQRRGVVA